MHSARDVASGSLLLLLAGIYSFAARELPVGRDEPGPAFFPNVLALALAVLAIIIIGRGIALRARREESGPTTRLFSNLGRPVVAMILTGGYPIALSTIGLVPSTFLYTLLMSRTLGGASWRESLVVPTVSSAFIYVLFDLGFQLPLPLPFWAW